MVPNTPPLNYWKLLKYSSLCCCWSASLRRCIPLDTELHWFSQIQLDGSPRLGQSFLLSKTFRLQVSNSHEVEPVLVVRREYLRAAPSDRQKHHLARYSVVFPFSECFHCPQKHPSSKTILEKNGEVDSSHKKEDAKHGWRICKSHLLSASQSCNAFLEKFLGDASTSTARPEIMSMDHNHLRYADHHTRKI